jgi:nitroimidazol reductase NimA-like FMN-containing flavoprotein (pyridoxamine 5'-phosphate oxidase superfamily)
VVICLDALPAAFPVNFALLDGDVVFRTAPGTKLSAALDETVVAFQADRIDPERCSGWTVLVQGTASVVKAPAELERARRLRIRPWVPGEHPHLVRIRSEVVSGRRLPVRADDLRRHSPHPELSAASGADFLAILAQ